MPAVMIPVIILLLAVLGVLLAGVFGMVRDGGTNPRRSNKLMRWRVLLQFAAVVLMLLILAARG